jgi:5'-phosphate synthase pdxT subunit
MPVLATCAGLILLAKDIKDQEETYFGTIPMCVKRNAYGRQLGSFFTTKEFEGIG